MGQPAADRNLLFGMLAVQLDFVAGDALLAAMHAWVRTKARPLGDILEEQGVLAADVRALLEALVDKHLTQHGGNPRQSLAVLNPPGAVHAQLQTLPDADVQASLAATGMHGTPGADAATRPYRSEVAGGRYRILRPYARGGLGEVYVALDAELNREVALKEIQKPYADSPEGRARFLLEAEVTGGLEHPGIVPVYGLGTYADGRPFYAMRFVRGDSLKEAIARFHTAAGSDRARSTRALALRGLLGRFVDVCQAVAYAHSRGVLHRDLKPGNIMLGKYGETLVVDWGLAKPLGRGDARSEEASPLAVEEPLRPSSGSTPTVAGTAVGTPAFMSPEQAAGRVNRLGPASDVYSLGATLYELLTGRPPFEGRDVGAVLQAVQQGDFPPPRRVQPDVPPALEAVCLKAMALAPQERYAAPRDLADEIERWLADEPVVAYPEPLPARVARFVRRHRTAVAAAAALLVTTVVALAASLVLVEGERTKTQQALDAESRRRQQAREALDALASELVEDWLATRKTLALTAGQKQFLEKALASYEEFAADTGRDESVRKGVGDAYLRVGTIRTRLGLYAEAEAAYRRAAEVFAGLVGDFPAVPGYRNDLAVCHNNLGIVLSNTGRVGQAEAAWRDGLVIQKQLVLDFPAEAKCRGELARSHNNLGLHLRENGRPQDAEAEHQAARALQQRLAAELPAVPAYRDEMAASHNNLALLFRATGRPKDAEKAFGDAIILQRRLATEFPAVPDYRRSLAMSQNNLAALLRETGRPKDAEPVQREALALIRQLAADYPTVPQYRLELAAKIHNFGVLLSQTGRPQDAVDAYREASAIRKQLVADFPTVPDYRFDLALGHYNLALLLRDLGRPQDAEAAHRDALAIQKQLAAEFPDQPRYREELAAVLDDLAGLLSERGRLGEAEGAWRDTRALRRQLAADFPARASYHSDLAGLLVNLANLRRRAGRADEARALLEEAVPHHRTAMAAEPQNATYRLFFKNNCRARARTLLDLGDHTAAAQAAEEFHTASADPIEAAYDAACYLSRCVPLAEKDVRLLAAQRREQAERYAGRSLALLREAVDKGFRDAAHLAKDNDLAPLRGRAEFQKLLRELGQGAKRTGS